MSQEQETQLLRDVPRLGFDKHMCPFPGALYSYLNYLNLAPNKESEAVAHLAAARAALSKA